MRERRLCLADGRLVSFVESGPEGGTPVFYLHGLPGSSLEPVAPTRDDEAPSLRLIAVDRPGFGASTPCTHYRLVDHAADIAAVADHLGIGRFSLAGLSMGGLYALASAAELGVRVCRVVIAGTPATALLDDPLQDVGGTPAAFWQMGRDDAPRLRAELAPVVGDTDMLLALMLAGLPATDQGLLTSRDIAPHYRRNIGMAIAQGGDTAATTIARELGCILPPWSMRLSDITAPVTIFHGLRDTFVGPVHGRALEAGIPGARLVLCDQDGHYGALYGSTAASFWQAAVETL